MDNSDTLRLLRAKKWLTMKGHFTQGLPELLLEFENYLLECEAKRQEQ